MIRCPKCRFVQDDAVECVRCGIVFTKYAERLLQVMEAEEEADVVTDTYLALERVQGPAPSARGGLETTWGAVARWALLLLLIPAAVGAGVLGTMTHRLHRTEAYATVTGFLGANERLATEVGDSELGWWIVGSIEADHESGTAMFVVPVRGAEGIGRVGATLVKAYGRWEVVNAGFIWPSGREVPLAGNGWTSGDRVPPCPRDIAAFRFTAEELLLRGEDFQPGSPEFSEKPDPDAVPKAAEPFPDEPPTPDNRPLYRKLTPEEVRSLVPSEEVRLGDEPPLWREQQLLTESQERLWLEGAPLKPTDLHRRRVKVGKTRAAGYLAAAWLNGVEGYEEGSLEWLQAQTPLVMYFRADWCPQCLEFERETLRAPRVREAMDRMVKVRVNPENSDAERRLADAWRVEGYPAVLVLPVQSPNPVAVSTHERDPGGVLRFPRWMLREPDAFLDRLKEAVAPR